LVVVESGTPARGGPARSARKQSPQPSLILRRPGTLQQQFANLRSSARCDRLSGSSFAPASPLPWSCDSEPEIGEGGQNCVKWVHGMSVRFAIAAKQSLEIPVVIRGHYRITS